MEEDKGFTLVTVGRSGVTVTYVTTGPVVGFRFTVVDIEILDTRQIDGRISWLIFERTYLEMGVGYFKEVMFRRHFCLSGRETSSWRSY